MADYGTLIHGTCRLQDLIPAFAQRLKLEMEQAPETRDDVKEYNLELIKQAEALFAKPKWEEEDEQFYLLDDLMEALQDYGPKGSYFGCNEGDGSDYGWWPAYEVMDEPGDQWFEDKDGE